MWDLLYDQTSSCTQNEYSWAVAASLCLEDSNLANIFSVYESCKKRANIWTILPSTYGKWRISNLNTMTIVIIHCTTYTQCMRAICVHVTQSSALKQIGSNKSSTTCLYSRLGICAHHASVKLHMCVCVLRACFCVWLSLFSYVLIVLNCCALDLHMERCFTS